MTNNLLLGFHNAAHHQPSDPENGWPHTAPEALPAIEDLHNSILTLVQDSPFSSAPDSASSLLGIKRPSCSLLNAS